MSSIHKVERVDDRSKEKVGMEMRFENWHKSAETSIQDSIKQFQMSISQIENKFNILDINLIKYQ